jgi:acetoin utilization protein AcuB
VLSPEDTVAHALGLMGEYHLTHLPVVSGDRYLGLVSEDDLLNQEDDRTELGHLENQMLRLAVMAGSHFAEAVHMATDYGLTLIPVVEKDKDMEWVGAFTALDLLKYLGRMTGADQPGGLIVLEIEKKDYSFSELSKLVETNDAQITQLNSYVDSQTQQLTVTLKINKFEISDIVATFQRYDYSVKYYFGEELYENELRNNYDHLMNYLNM